MRLTDTHTHLDFPDFDADRDEVLARSRALGVQRMVVLGVYQANWQRLWQLVEANEGLHAAFGFVRVGTLRSAGFKFGRWVDSVLMQRPLGPGDGSPPTS